jgi:hypothetical protein
MIINGIALALLDVPIEAQDAYSRWYDLDHLPEHLSKPDVVTAARYVSAEGTDPAAVASDRGHPPFATIYSFGGPLEFTSEDALSGWASLDRALTKSGRFWKDATITHASRWRLGDAVKRPSIPVSNDAIPHLAHSGVIMSFGRHPIDGRDAALRWWRETQQDDLIDVSGVGAILQFDPVDGSDTVLHLLLCTEDVSAVLARLREVRELHRHLGRYPAFRGAYETEALLPYRRLAPLGYGDTRSR